MTNTANEIIPVELLNTLNDTINHPSHYTQNNYEPIDVIEDWDLNFNLGNVIKYVARAPFKGHQIQDLEKARFYLDREITRLKKVTI